MHRIWMIHAMHKKALCHKQPKVTYTLAHSYQNLDCWMWRQNSASLLCAHVRRYIFSCCSSHYSVVTFYKLALEGCQLCFKRVYVTTDGYTHFPFVLDWMTAGQVLFSKKLLLEIKNKTKKKKQQQKTKQQPHDFRRNRKQQNVLKHLNTFTNTIAEWWMSDWSKFTI